MNRSNWLDSTQIWSLFWLHLFFCWLTRGRHKEEEAWWWPERRILSHGGPAGLAIHFAVWRSLWLALHDLPGIPVHLCKAKGHLSPCAINHRRYFYQWHYNDMLRDMQIGAVCFWSHRSPMASDAKYKSTNYNQDAFGELNRERNSQHGVHFFTRPPGIRNRYFLVLIMKACF